MDSDAGSSLARRRHRLSPPLLPLSLFFAFFIHFLQIYLLYLGFISSSFAKSCASFRTCHIKASWLLLLICNPAPAITAALGSDLTFDGCICTDVSRPPKILVRSDLHLSSSSWMVSFLPMGKTCSSVPCREVSFLAGVLRCSFARSTSTCCSEFYFSTPMANRTLREDPKTIFLSRPLPFTEEKSGVCSDSLSKTGLGNKRFNYGFINVLWLRYGNIGVRSLFLATASAFPSNLVKRFCFNAGVKMADRHLFGNVPMDLVSFGYTFATSSGIYIALVRSTAVCSFLMGSIPVVGVLFLYLSSWWQVEEKLIVIFSPMNMADAGFDFPLVPHLKQSSFLIFPLVWSELDEKASLVLQGSSSHRMLFSAYGAVCVVLRVTLDAIFQEAYDIVVLRFNMVSFCDMYHHSIFYVIVVVCLALVVSLYPPLMEVNLI